ncbi:MAG TPA: hypothetical protein VK689_01025 [Armatimonadota bacterium]|nr:hypothetical protein [Armatimonadota bacterium]
MRKILIGLSLAAMVAGGVARAAETAEAIPAEFLQQFSPLAMQLIQQQFPNPPVKVDLNADKAVGYHVKEMVAVVVIPDKAITGKAVEDAADKDVPVAVIATKSLTVRDKDKAVGADQLSVADFNGMFKIPVFYVAVRGKGTDRTLEIYSKDGKAISSTPLKKQAGDANQPVAVKLNNIDMEKKTLDLTVGVAGAYEGTVPMSFLDL